MRRTLSTLGAALVAAALLSACGGPVSDPAAAKVNGTTISRTELQDQLAVLADNTKWLAAIAPEFGDEPLTAPNGNLSTTISAAWLTALMNQAVVDQAFERRDLEVSQENRQAAETAAEQLFNTDQGPTFESMPKWFRDDFIEGQARYEAVRATVPDNPEPTQAQLEEMFERTRTQYCTSGNAVSHILAATREQAEQIEAALAQGQDFALLARRSEDAGTRDAGGFLTCTGSPNFQQLPEGFRTAVAAIPVGGTSPVIQTDVGFHVVRVTPFDLASVRPFLVNIYRQSLSPPMTQFVNNQLLRAKLWVDPRFGRLARGPVRVEPPRPPSPAERPPANGAPAGPTGP